MTIVQVLGTAQDGGVPQPGCFCTNCQQAKLSPRLRRNAACLGIVDEQTKEWTLVDATPDFKLQMEQLETAIHPKPQSIWLTHAHIGHYPGLIFLGKEAMNTHELPVYAGAELGEFLQSHLPWSTLVESKNISIKALQHGKTYYQGDYSIIPLLVPHRTEYSETFGFVINGGESSLLYIPDIDRWEDWEEELLCMANEVDYCLLDATFYSEKEVRGIGREPKSIPHPFMEETMDRLQPLVDRKEVTVYFTHLNHSNPVLNPNTDACKTVSQRGFRIAEEGMTIQL
ncbi:pyrroloquinoline quinone biosynthesis protein PqqB [Pontibacillus sp. ALD_SL1]|uniref:MBL fold metallo-hydrolase n=1 Tax=Pontibacillus sp. ALD_SL1 TaxID=2777185 RepID=UPI001A974FC0|nr:MBL fold metallo-hydrolase [Pontibacillus sp. ALD_SL1]QSS98768.1 pyrroloquinoline quinone biosynthesis protein PqqB [Pontibacillus sp. ALD_SL1]